MVRRAEPALRFFLNECHASRGFLRAESVPSAVPEPPPGVPGSGTAAGTARARPGDAAGTLG